MRYWSVKVLKILQCSAATLASPRNSLFVSVSAKCFRLGLLLADPTQRFFSRRRQNPSQEKILTNATLLVLL
jgi:hypothetical protein